MVDLYLKFQSAQTMTGDYVCERAQPLCFFRYHKTAGASITCQGEKSDVYLALKSILLAIISEVASISKKSQFGKNVCRLRSEKKLTQERFAEKADISRRYLQQIEAGEMNPTVGVAARLRAALQCSWDQLFDKL